MFLCCFLRKLLLIWKLAKWTLWHYMFSPQIHKLYWPENWSKIWVILNWGSMLQNKDFHGTSIRKILTRWNEFVIKFKYKRIRHQDFSKDARIERSLTMERVHFAQKQPSNLKLIKLEPNNLKSSYFSGSWMIINYGTNHAVCQR